MALILKVGDQVTLKKEHPCGSHDWEILRTGMDFRIKCIGCGRQVWIARKELERRIKQVLREGEIYKPDQLKYGSDLEEREE